MASPTLRTRSPDWGFHGAIARTEAAPAADLTVACEIAFSTILTATAEAPEAVRAFLDNRHGRRFADEVAKVLARGENLGIAIDAAVRRWTTLRIGRRTSRETGIPQGCRT